MSEIGGDGRDQPRFVFDHVGEPPPEYAADRFGRKRVLPEADRLRERFELPLDRVLLPALLFQVVVPNVVTVAALDLETVDSKCVRIERTDLYAPGGESPVGERPGPGSPLRPAACTGGSGGPASACR